MRNAKRHGGPRRQAIVRRCCLASIAVLLLLLVAPSMTQASSYVCRRPYPPAKAFDYYHAVFVGEVISNEDSRVAPFFPSLQDVYAKPIRTRIRVTSSWKGVNREETTIWTGTNWLSGGLVVQPGERYIFYTHRCAGRHCAYKCTRTGPVAKADKDLAFLASRPELDLKPKRTIGRLLSLPLALSAALIFLPAIHQRRRTPSELETPSDDG